MPTTISINGADNVGKTTQIGLLPQDWRIVRAGPIHEYDLTMSTLKETSRLNEWWWSSSHEDFVLVIFGAIKKRFVTVTSDNRVNAIFFDRGTRMFMAVAAAAISVKDGQGNVEYGRKKLQEILLRNNIDPPFEDVSVLLKHDLNLETAVKIGLERETEPVSKQYRDYQYLLHQELDAQGDGNGYDFVYVEAGPASHRRIQDQLRKDLASFTLPYVFLPILARVKTIFAIAGLSEAGKSSYATQLVATYGQHARRLKIGYFLKHASDNMRQDVYKLDEKEQALALLHELEAYSLAHYWVDTMTIESVHRFSLIEWLKTWLDDTLQIIYIDTADAVRFQRSGMTRSDFDEKDKTKKDRGAERVRNIADLVFDNNGNQENVVATVNILCKERRGITGLDRTSHNIVVRRSLVFEATRVEGSCFPVDACEKAC